MAAADRHLALSHVPAFALEACPLVLEPVDCGVAAEVAALVTPGYSGEHIDLERALASLAPTARAIVWMYEVEGYSHPEIASAFGRSVSFSKSQLARAHVRLRAALEPRKQRTSMHADLEPPTVNLARCCASCPPTGRALRLSGVRAPRARACARGSAAGGQGRGWPPPPYAASVWWQCWCASAVARRSPRHPVLPAR